jgi:serine/threonine-protein kinase
MSVDSPSSPYTDRVVSERYRLKRLLGQGGFGFVYEAEHVKLPRRFAIKFLHRQHEIDEQFVKRFEREARITAQLDHAAIVAVTDFGEDETLGHYFVMEFLNGEDLAARIRRTGPVTSAEAVRLMLSIVDACAFG